MTHNYGFMEDHKKFSAKGGKKKNPMKGFGSMKVNDPVRFKKIVEKAHAKKVQDLQ